MNMVCQQYLAIYHLRFANMKSQILQILCCTQNESHNFVISTLSTTKISNTTLSGTQKRLVSD